MKKSWPTSVKPTSVGKPSAEATAKAKELNERFTQSRRQEENPLELLYDVNRDMFFTTIATMTNIDVQKMCTLTKKSGARCATLDFWKQLWNNRFPDVDLPQSDKVDEIRQAYYNRNFADRLLMKIGLKEEPLETITLATKAKGKDTHSYSLAVREQNLLIKYRNELRKRGVNGIVDDLSRADFLYSELLNYAIQTDDLEFFVLALLQVGELGEDIEQRLTRKDHSKLISNAFEADPRVRDYFMNLTPKEIIDLMAADEYCGYDLLKSRLDMKVAISHEDVEEAKETAEDLECQDIIDMLEEYSPPDIETELDYMVETIGQAAEEGVPLSSPINAIFEKRKDELAESPDYAETYFDFISDLIVNENLTAEYFIIDSTGGFPDSYIRMLLHIIIDTPGAQKEEWNYIIRELVKTFSHDTLDLTRMLDEGLKKNKITENFLQTVLTTIVMHLDSRTFEKFLGRLRRAAPTDKMILYIVTVEKDLYKKGLMDDKDEEYD